MKTIAIALGLFALTAGVADAGSLENMERERTLLIETLLTPELTPEERQEKTALAKRRLVDLERMTLRDKSLTGQNTPQVRRAFANYDLTFLVHSSVEKNVHVIDQWLEQFGLTSQTLSSARIGRR